MDEQSNPQTIDTFDGLDIRRTGGGFLSSTASLRISDGVVIFLLCSLDLQKKHHHFCGCNVSLSVVGCLLSIVCCLLCCCCCSEDA